MSSVATAQQLQFPPAARPARTNAAASETVNRLPVGDTQRASAGLGRLDHGLRHEQPLARLEAAGLEHALRCLPASHTATAMGRG